MQHRLLDFLLALPRKGCRQFESNLALGEYAHGSKIAANTMPLTDDQANIRGILQYLGVQALVCDSDKRCVIIAQVWRPMCDS